jgi:hypothetical protein
MAAWVAAIEPERPAQSKQKIVQNGAQAVLIPLWEKLQN